MNHGLSEQAETTILRDIKFALNLLEPTSSECDPRLLAVEKVKCYLNLE